MKDREQIKNALIEVKFSPEFAEKSSQFWQKLVAEIPVGTRVYRVGEEGDVRETKDGGFYDDAMYLYFNVSGRGHKEWRVLEVRKASDATDTKQ
jgi:hypothetical protein